MHPDLVGAAGHRHTSCKAKAVFFLYNSILRAAGLALGGDAAPDDAVAPAADGCIDDPFPQRQRALRNGIVQLFHPACQQRCGVGVFRRQHKAAGVLINAVHRAEHRAVAVFCRPRGVAICQRTTGVVQGGVHRQLRRLFQHHRKGVLVDHLDRNFRLRGHAVPFRRQGKGEHLPGEDAPVCQHGHTVRKKAAAPELDRPGKVSRDGTLAQKAAHQHPLVGGCRIRHGKIQLHGLPLPCKIHKKYK